MDAARLRLADLIEVLSEPTLLSDENGGIQAAISRSMPWQATGLST